MPKNDYPSKMKYFDYFTKIAKNVADLGKIKVAESAINRPIWSHCWYDSWKHLQRESFIAYSLGATFLFEQITTILRSIICCSVNAT